MCGRAMYNKQLMVPGSYMNFTIQTNKIVAGIWGMLQTSGTPLVNARIESLRNTWKHYMENRGIIELNGFFEGDFYFGSNTDVPLKVPVIYDSNYDFAILTRTAKELVSPVHKRQPILIAANNEKEWLATGMILQLEDKYLERIHKTKMNKAA